MTWEEIREADKRASRVQHFEKVFIRQDKKPFRRFWKLVWFWTKKPFTWIWRNRKDWRTVVIYCAVNVVMSSPVWVCYVIAVISGWAGDKELSASMWATGSACWAFWAGPFTPYTVICIFLTVGIRELLMKTKTRRKKK